MANCLACSSTIFCSPCLFPSGSGAPLSLASPQSLPTRPQGALHNSPHHSYDISRCCPAWNQRYTTSVVSCQDSIARVAAKSLPSPQSFAKYTPVEAVRQARRHLTLSSKDSTPITPITGKFMRNKPPGLLIRGPVDGTAKICTL